VKFVIGGRTLDTNAASVTSSVSGLEPDSIRKHQVDINGVQFPPKQVLGAVSGWDRQSFTTQEARRVLEKLGFKCRRLRDSAESEETEVDEDTSSDDLDPVRAAFDVVNLAVAELARRVAVLEERR
jgi:hypothetical protein